MNIFLPYPNDITLSVQSLDNKRLNKQIVEIATLLEIAIDEKQNGSRTGAGYHNHPIYKHYKDNLEFFAWYGVECCCEYTYRKPFHFRCEMDLFNKYYRGKVSFIPFYASGSKGSKDCIRTTENVGELYRQRLVQKWQNDKNENKYLSWGNREKPKFWSIYV